MPKITLDPTPFHRDLVDAFAAAVSSVFAEDEDEDENADEVSRFQLDTITKGLHR